jgi:hypothetical protein
MEVKEKRYPGACFDCGGAVTISQKLILMGVCENCGPVGEDFIDRGAEPVWGFSARKRPDSILL